MNIFRKKILRSATKEAITHARTLSSLFLFLLHARAKKTRFWLLMGKLLAASGSAFQVWRHGLIQ